jgi:flagellar FliJ protein
MNYLFPFQKIVDLKANQTSQSKWLLQSAINVLHKEEGSLVEMFEQREEIVNQLIRLHEAGSPVAELLNYQQYLSHIDSTIKLQNNEVKKAECEVTCCREDLTRNEQQEKTWYKLKEKRFRQYLVELNREEQKELDEIGSYQHSRSGKSS